MNAQKFIYAWKLVVRMYFGLELVLIFQLSKIPSL